MSDDVDLANAHRDAEEEARIREARLKAQAVAKVVTWAGECEECGEDHPRLVKWVCPRCRDRLGLP